MKQQTPLRKAIAEIEADAKYKPIQYQLAINQAVSVLTNLLPEERRVINDSFEEGYNYNEHARQGERYIASDFFTSNFEQ
jgi:hypothetical protein